MAGKKCTAKRKDEDEHRMFLTEWECLYFFVERNGKPFCLICQTSLAHFKASNLQRHFSSLHANIDQEFPKGTELHKHELDTLKSQAEKQIQFFQKFTKRSETITLASYQLAWNIARAKKPYNEGEFVKKCLSDVVEILSPENDKLKRMVSDIQLSRHTVEHRISDINTAIESQLHSDLQACILVSHWMRVVIYKTSLSWQYLHICVKRLCDPRRTPGYCAIKRQNPWDRCERNHDGCI